MITIENLTKYYGSNRAVNHISFTINDNEILGFLGPNGAGKSTTMNMIAGFLPMFLSGLTEGKAKTTTKQSNKNIPNHINIVVFLLHIDVDLV